jgi:dTDP-4-dehydrorhamnose reductase
MTIKTVLVTGANGQLGRCLRDVSKKYPELRFHFLGREHLPIQDFALTDSIVETLKPDLIINAAAYTAVDKAEEEKDEANQINGYAVGNLAAAAKRVGSRLFHVSTDYVFNGNGKEPYKEDDENKEPVNAYGKSKRLGEVLAMQENPETVLVRTSWVYSPYGKNFVKTMVSLMVQRPEIRVVADQIGAPTSAHDLAEVIFQIGLSNNWIPGIYHYSNQAEISWYAFAVKIKEIKALNSCTIYPIATKDFPTPANRPAYSCLDCSKLYAAYGIELKHWILSLERVLLSL